jgi:hypothetical protein
MAGSTECTFYANEVRGSANQKRSCKSAIARGYAHVCIPAGGIRVQGLAGFAECLGLELGLEQECYSKGICTRVHTCASPLRGFECRAGFAEWLEQRVSSVSL